MKRQTKTDKPRQKLSLDPQAVRELDRTDLEHSVGGREDSVFSTSVARC